MAPLVKPKVGMGGGAPELPGLGAGLTTDTGLEEGGEKASLAKVKDLLQQAMDMLGELGANDEVAGVGQAGPAFPPTPADRRPPMKPRPGAGPGPMGMI